MATMNVSLPETMKKWVNTQVKTGRYGNASDYVRDLIRRDQDQLSRITELRAQLEREEKIEKTKSIIAKGKITRSEKTKTSNASKNEIAAKVVATKGKKKEQSMDAIRKNVLARVKKNWRPTD